MGLKARNNFVLVIRDEEQTTSGSFIIPGKGRERPHQGTVYSVGGLVKDPEIKKSTGKKVIFHKTVGFTLEIDNVEYTVLTGEEIIGEL